MVHPRSRARPRPRPDRLVDRDMLRLLRTARYVPASQALAWARARLGRRLRGNPALRMDAPVRQAACWPDLARRMAALEAISFNEARALDLVDRRFSFVGVERRIAEIDWSAEYVSPLWTYHLHYFDYSLDVVRAWLATGDRRFEDAFTGLWASWIDAAAAGRARIEPYTVSVRAMNALRSLWLTGDRLSESFRARLLAATHAQLDWLSDHIERHLRANHLQKNLAALAWGSLAFDHPSVSRWNDRRQELWDELREQVLSDGGHFERSPMYHAGALDDFLRTLALCRSAGVAVPADVAGRLVAMTRAFQCLSRTDGTLHLFNDAANGEIPDRSSAVALARAVLGEPFEEPAGAFALEETGYFGIAEPVGGMRLLVDAGPLGPSYQPGHAHCDMLSFELDLGGRPVVVDSGLHGYDGDPFREYVRSTRAHNTVAIAGRDQHEMWATFRVGRRGEVVEARATEPGDGSYEFRGACRHYHDRRAIHHRNVTWRGERLLVTDRITGAEGSPLVSWLHLHPDFDVFAEAGGRTWIATSGRPGGRDVIIDAQGAVEVTVRRGDRDPVQGWYLPRFGQALASPALEFRVRANDGNAFGYSIRLEG